jgi:hypothetical protein
LDAQETRRVSSWDSTLPAFLGHHMLLGLEMEVKLELAAVVVLLPLQVASS